MEDTLTDRIRSYVDGHAAEQLDFVIRMCDRNSYTYNRDGTNEVSGMIHDRLGGILPHRESVRQNTVGDHHILRTRPSSEGVYLLGHMDTVFPPDHPFQECAVDGDWLTGPGTGDMKGGLAVMVYALLALHESGILDQLDITFILSADEEVGAVTSRALYERERGNARVCLVAECAGPDGEVVISRNGKAGLRLECLGEDIHVGRVSGAKRSAVLEMAHKVIAVEALNGCFPGVTVNVGTVEGGLGPCTVPARAHSLIDIRWLEEKHYGDLLSEVRKIADQPVCPDCRCQVTVLNHRPAMPVTEQTEKLYGMLQDTARSLGITIGREHRRGTSDANFFGSAGIPTLDGLGPVCHDDHTPNERVLIPTLTSRTILLALLLAERFVDGATGMM
jgi:glutamate carboxypeptidase